MTNQQNATGATAENINHIPFDTDAGVAHRAAIGLIVLSTDQTIEHEFRFIFKQQGVAYYESRIPNSNRITPETLKEMEKLIEDQTDVLSHARLPVDDRGESPRQMKTDAEAVEHVDQLRERRPEAVSGEHGHGARRSAPGSAGPLRTDGVQPPIEARRPAWAHGPRGSTGPENHATT